MTLAIFTTKYNLEAVDYKLIPKSAGIYCFYVNSDGSPYYIGSATGKNGLKGRLLDQHLNPKYLETRASVFTSFDKSQIHKGIMRNGKIVVEKSTFRKKIARLHDLAPGESVVEFIRSHYSLSFIQMPNADKAEILKLEKDLIFHYQPILNSVGMR